MFLSSKQNSLESEPFEKLSMMTIIILCEEHCSPLI